MYTTLMNRFSGMLGAGNQRHNASENERAITRYRDTHRMNVTAIFANRLTKLATSESTVEGGRDTLRADSVMGILERLWGEIDTVTATVLGTGGVVVVPFYRDGVLDYKWMTQEKFVIKRKRGAEIMEAMINIGQKSDKDGKNKRFKWMKYNVAGEWLEIDTFVTNEKGEIINDDSWTDEPVRIYGVERVPVAFVKCPIDKRSECNTFGVPITYGADAVIDEYINHRIATAKEYDLKKVRVLMDERAFDDTFGGAPRVVDDMFMSVHGDDAFVHEVYSPDIRATEFETYRDTLARDIEAIVGTSTGILSRSETQMATATEVRRANADTIAIVTKVQTALRRMIDDVVYALGVLSNHYGVTPYADVVARVDFIDPFEDVEQAWGRLIQMNDRGLASGAELRAYSTGETIEEAKVAIAELEANEPTIASLMTSAGE